MLPRQNFTSTSRVATRGHTVPASALVQTVQALQRAIHLLAVTHEGRDFKERLRVSYELERKYSVIFKVPEDGGYDIPYVIGNTASTLFEPQDVAIVTEQYQASLAAVQNNDFQALKRIIPLAQVRRQYVTALKNMQPPKRMGLVVSIEDACKQKLLDGHTAASRLAPMLNEPVTPSVKPRVVTGRLDALDFQSRNLTLQLFTGRRLSCTYGEDFEPILLENPREWIQVRGEAVLNEDDSLKALNNVTEIIEVDDSEITVESIILGGVQRAAATSVTFAVSFEPEDGIYTATGDFHMMVTGDTRDELEKAVTDALEFLWREYFTADPSDFSADALALRDRLIQTFAEVKNAA
jgi:hypothetical protein